ncbi:MAG: hypothetical protein K8H74_11830 [Notoacmeibacter sp.]|nr:hypothetical protein [Notoacmeibacter sp.]
MVHWYGGADGPLVLRSPRASNFPEAIADRLKIGKLLIPLTKAGHLALVFTALKSWLEKFGNNSKNRPKTQKIPAAANLSMRRGINGALVLRPPQRSSSQQPRSVRVGAEQS